MKAVCRFSMARPIKRDIQFEVCLSNSEDATLNEQNSERLNPDNARTIKHAIVDMSNHRRVAIQAINQQQTGELIEVDLSVITPPLFLASEYC